MPRGKKDGQAMIEFMMGLVGIVILLLGLELVAHVAVMDFEDVFNARTDVAEDLVNGAYSSPGSSASGFNPSDSIGVLDVNINGNSGGAYEDYQAAYPQSARPDGFAFLAQGGNPLDQMAGSDKGGRIAITSPLMQQILGRSSIRVENAVWMPPLGDLK